VLPSAVPQVSPLHSAFFCRKNEHHKIPTVMYVSLHISARYFLSQYAHGQA